MDFCLRRCSLLTCLPIKLNKTKTNVQQENQRIFLVVFVVSKFNCKSVRWQNIIDHRRSMKSSNEKKMVERKIKVKRKTVELECCLCFLLLLTIITVCMTRVGTALIMFLSRVLALIFLSSYLPFCLIESLLKRRASIFYWFIFLHTLALEIESKSLLLFKYNIIVAERSRRHTNRKRQSA